MPRPSPDDPILTPGDDLYGVEPFAKALASSIADMKAPEGIVIGVNGVWGSGKTSALGLMRYHLDPHVKNEEVVIIDFSPWWFTSQEALIGGFFNEVGTKIDASLGDQMKGAFRAIGKRISSFGELAGVAADTTGLPGAGMAAKGAVGVVGQLLGSEETVVEVHQRLARQLGEQEKRLLVIIDDIDRLSPEDALALFRLVKSVGRMPNVIYVLAFDRRLAERLVKERYPAEGAHYLEKIVQVWFDLPVPMEFDLRQVFLRQLEEIVGPAHDADSMVRVMNAFYAIVARHLKTPRDVVRLMNVLRVSYPPVQGEVDVADFLGIEAIRLFQPEVHAVIAHNGNMLCGGLQSGSEKIELRRSRYDALLLGSVADGAKDATREVLCRLFPGLDSVWNGHGYDVGFEDHWRAERRLCSKAHFDTYFRFGISEETLPVAELDAIIACADDAGAVQEALRRAATVPRRTGGTRAAVLIEELTVSGNRIAEVNVPTFLGALFGIADELDTDADKPTPFHIADNQLRLHWLMYKLLLRRFTLAERSRIVAEAAKGATLAWLATLAEHCIGQNKPNQSEDDRLVDGAAVGEIVAIAVDRLRRAAEDGSMARRDDVCGLLHRWRRLDPEGQESGQRLVARNLDDDGFVIKLAAGSISTISEHFSGDLVTQQKQMVKLERIAPFVDIQEFERRVAEVSARAGGDRAVARILAHFRDLPRSDDDD